MEEKGGTMVAGIKNNNDINNKKEEQEKEKGKKNDTSKKQARDTCRGWWNIYIKKIILRSKQRGENLTEKRE